MYLFLLVIFLTQIYLIMKNAELKEALTALKAQVQKAKEEINTKIAAMQQAIDNADSVPAEVEAAFGELKTAVQGVDDIVPDAVPPVTETPATETPAPEQPAAEGDESL